MYYELSLIIIALAGAYWGQFFVRRQPNGTPWFGVMLFGATALSLLGLLGRHVDSPILGAAGAIGVGAGACMLVVGPLLRVFARRLAGVEKFGAAARLLDVADVLAPGSGVGEEKALLGAMREIREGRIEQTVEALTHAKHGAPPEARLAIDERIAMLYLAAYRWDEGIAHAEAHLWDALPRDHATPDTSIAAPIALRRALGIAPPVWVELLGAYGRTGDLDRAADMLVRLEDVCAGRADTSSTMWIHRARMIFLALAGRVEAVEALTTARTARHLSASARTYWRAVAHEKHGDRDAAGQAYTRARRGSRGMPRELIDKALAKLTNIKPVELGETATQVVKRIESAPLPEVGKLPRPQRMLATWTLTALLVGVALAVELAFGASEDHGVMLRSGAMLHTQIAAGQWWRLASCVFVHGGALHLIANAVALFLIGRFAEEVFGTVRTFAIFALAGLAGSLASFAMAPGPSVGASGAILGLLGAVLVEITLYRDRHTALRPIWGVLLLVTIGQLALGFLSTDIDQWAHGGGLAAGALAGLLLSPSAPWRRAGKWLALAVALGAGVAVAFATAMVATTSAVDHLSAGPSKAWQVGGVTVDAPASWGINDGELVDADVFVVLAVERSHAPAVAPALAAYAKNEPDRARSRHFDQIAVATERLIPLPPGWDGSELDVSVEDALGERVHYRVVVAGKQMGDTIVLASMYLPDSLARVAPQFFTDLIASAR